MEPTKRTKLQKLVAAYERFGAEIAGVPDAWAERLHIVSSGVAGFASDNLSRRDTKPGELAAGLEQGLRETPDLSAAVAPEYRPKVAAAFYRAVTAEYPDFFNKDAKRLDKVLARGRIRTEPEFYLVRHFLDTLEGVPQATSTVQQLYELLGAYEARA